mgnify:FL=1
MGKLRSGCQPKNGQAQASNASTIEEARPVNMEREMLSADKVVMFGLLKEFKDVFAWSYKDMKVLDH